MDRRRAVFVLFCSVLVFTAWGKKPLNPYKVLGVDRSASQRDIQKAFHKLSLKYHPDKNKAKVAQEKFSEINNAYDILSDEEKKKNYDMYGDESGNQGFGGGNFGHGHSGGRDGYTYFTSGGGGPGPDAWQGMGGQGNSFSFSFGGHPGAGDGSSGFDFGDMFSNFFGGQSGGSGSRFGNFGGSAGQRSGQTSQTSIRTLDLQAYKNEIVDRGLTWLLLFYNPYSSGYNAWKSVINDVAISLQGAMKSGKFNCQAEPALCKELGVHSTKSAKVFFYSYQPDGSTSLVQYTDELDSRRVKNFCLDHLPRFSKRVDLSNFEFSSETKGDLPQVLLLSTKKDTPVMWRTISGLYRKRFILFDAEAHDTTRKTLKRFGVHALPALVGRMTDGELAVLKEGITVKDLKTGISEISSLLNSFEKKIKVASKRATKESKTDDQDGRIPHLTISNLDSVCGDETTLCVIGVYRSAKAKGKLEANLSLVSRKTLTRRRNLAEGSKDSVQYALLDANSQPSILKSFDESGFKSSDGLVLAYKPRKGKYAVFRDGMVLEEVEGFISSVLNGDVRFSKIKQKPTSKWFWR